MKMSNLITTRSVYETLVAIVIKFSQNTIFQYFFSIIATLAVLFISTHLTEYNFHYPISYQGDGLASAAMVKTIIETGWNSTNPNLGSPLTFNMANYPMVEGFHYLLIKFIALFSNNYAVVINTFYILSFPFAALSALIIMKQLGLRYPFAFVASILFAMAPYHFQRVTNHLFLSFYFTIPISTWLAILTVENKVFKNYQYKILCPLLCLLIGSSGAYYAFFGMFFISLGGLMSLIQSRKIKCLFPSLYLVSLITLSILINLSPSIIYKIKNPEHVNISQRAPSDSEIYGLNITAMFLPTEAFPSQYLQDIKNKYFKVTRLPASEPTNLGLFASLGFILLIVLLLVRSKSFLNNRIHILCILNAFAIFLSTMGGFGSLIAYSFFSQIRCYNRISIFIMFFSITCFFYLIQRTLKNTFLYKNISLLLSTLLILLITGVITQKQVFIYRWSPDWIAKMESDKNFIEQIETILPANSSVFQLPYIAFPESPKVNDLENYDHFRAYLNSHSLKWSFGAMKEDSNDLWQRKVSSLPIQSFVNNLIYQNFNGLYIDRRGFLDHGKTLELNLINFLHVQPFESKDNNLSFFDLRTYSQKLKIEEGNELWQRHKELAQNLNIIT